ncbi:glutathione S-transferase [Luminiphilus syltensis NOR5-1B]|uniref:Glutathione S-transferase n=1 Tax=Luminiphilus syltensis NOR5-1B TaxID=565045 RepID=B8KTS3_9GAMM|nr:glutathione S-transferase family protein [Luminiphilus syltensis]EED36581.1 glutathione S-transferase [Luminiphilus syltensis NOR5-1B]
MTEPLFILHHYEASPYAEKIRLLLGAAGLSWRSVLSPPQPPRPNIDPLAGGYRRIPVAQIGADVFCDTALIAEEVLALSNNTDLNSPATDPEVDELVERAEGDVFFAAITSVPPLRVLSTLLRSFGPLGALRFIKDRGAMMKTAKVRPPKASEAKALLDAHQAQLNAVLSRRDYLNGDGGQAGLADFSVYHALWLAKTVGQQPLPAGMEALSDWFERIDAIGQGNRTEVAPSAAFEQARNHEPRAITEPGQDQRLGSRVAVAPNDYGLDPVGGTLVCANDSRIIVGRDTPDMGTVHVHFPLQGFEIRSVDAA